MAWIGAVAMLGYLDLYHMMAGLYSIEYLKEKNIKFFSSESISKFTEMGEAPKIFVHFAVCVFTLTPQNIYPRILESRNAMIDGSLDHCNCSQTLFHWKTFISVKH
jgi:hypothetical protein